MRISDIAGVCYAVNRDLSRFYGDESHLPWEEASAWQVESTCYGVAALMTTPDITPEEQHDLWVAHKLENGWSYGPEKDEVKKTHPCMVDYHDLPEHQRLKDILFQSVVRALLPMMVRGRQDTYTAEQVLEAIDDEELTGECTPELFNAAAASMDEFIHFSHMMVLATKNSIAERLGLKATCTCGAAECAGPLSTTCGLVQAELAFVEEAAAMDEGEPDLQHVADFVGTKVELADETAN